MSEEAYQAFLKLSYDEREALYFKLLAYTIQFAERYHWRDGVMPNGFEPQDIAQRIVKKTLYGDFNWDPNETDLLQFMCGRVRSEFSKLLSRRAYKYERHALADEDIYEVIDRENYTDDFIERVDPAAWFLAIEENEERNVLACQYIDELLEEVEGKPELEQVLYAILDGCEEKPRYLAEWLDVPVSEINKRLKRLRSRADKIRLKRMPS